MSEDYKIDMSKISLEAQQKYEVKNGIDKKEKREILVPRFVAEGKKPEKSSTKVQKYRRKEPEKSWKKVKKCEEPKKEIDKQLADKIRISLAIIGLASAIGFTGVACKKIYDWGYNYSTHFWDETKERMEKQREEKEILYGDTFPNGEKKRKLTHEEWENLPGDSRKYIQEPPIDLDEERK